MWKRLAVCFIILFTSVVTVLTITRSSPVQAQFPPSVPTSTPGGPVGPPSGQPVVPTPTLVLTPTPPLTPLPTSIAPGCGAGLPISIGATVTVRSGVNIRYGPSASSPWLANYQEPRNFLVLDGPVCDGNFLWWQIRGHGISGWVAERSNALNFVTFIDATRIGGDCPAPLSLSTGEVIELITGVRIRQNPGLESLVLTVAPFGASAVVLSDSPECEDGFNWRLVRVEVVDVIYDGWMAEGSSSIAGEFFIAQDQPDSICSPPMRLAIGDTGRVRVVDGIPKNLRAAPGLTGEILYTLVNAVPFEVIGGPVCIDDQIWWQVRIRSNLPAAGWIAQGPRPNFWLDRDDEPSPIGVPDFSPPGG